MHTRTDLESRDRLSACALLAHLNFLNWTKNHTPGYRFSLTIHRAWFLGTIQGWARQW